MQQEIGLSLIAVIMYSPSSDTRFEEAQKLLNYGFANYTNISFGDKGDVIGTVSVEKGTISMVNAVLEEDASMFVKKSASSNIVQNITLSESIEAPVNEGDIIGNVVYTVEDEVIKTVNIVAGGSSKKLNLVNMAGELYGDWFSLLR